MRAAAALLACLSFSCTSTTAPYLADDLMELERGLTRALVRKQHGVIRGFLAPDFRCSVPGTLELEPGRASISLCTGISGKPTAGTAVRTSDSPFVDSIHRNAAVHDIEIDRDGDKAVVTSRQEYRGWFPYDGLEPRVAKVTDTWIRHEGRWKLLERVSEPL